MADFTSYNQVSMWLSKGRKQSEGRKHRSLLLRLRPDSAITVEHSYFGGEPFAELYPDDTFKFVLSSSEMIDLSASMSQVLHKVFGLSWVRAGMARYVVQRVEPGRAWWRPEGGHEHFCGMKWNISTGECLNPRPSVLDHVDRDARKVWMAALRKFRRALDTRIKLGVVKNMIDARDGTKKSPTRPDVVRGVLTALKTGELHTDLLEDIISHACNITWRRQTSVEGVRSLVTGLINSNSIRFRQEFGVLKEYK